jgi:hypothetical protein
MGLEEGRHAAAGLQPWLIQVQIQPVDPFEVQGDMVLQPLPAMESGARAGSG